MLQFAFIYLLHMLPGHGLEVDGMMGNWKMSEGVKQSRGKVGKWVELTVFRLRIMCNVGCQAIHFGKLQRYYSLLDRFMSVFCIVSFCFPYCFSTFKNIFVLKAKKGHHRNRK